MSKEKYYSKIKRYIYRKFEELEVVDQVNYLYLRYKNEPLYQIAIRKESGDVYYFHVFRDKILNPIPMEQDDFEILLGIWVEETFQINVNSIDEMLY